MNLTEPEKRLVTRLLQLPADERDAALAEACRADTALGGRRAVLAAALAAAAAPPVQRSADEAVSILEAALEPLAEDTPGARIGPYRLLEKIGEGGFGSVWMAEQTAPVRRRVALKIIKLGMDTEEVIARFEAERQALALMNHPNIAQVFDAGATDSGRPFFVMELVRGVAITRYGDENSLPTPARLNLFITVCQAVQHAHQKGVIHRDLKPSNILVTLHDGVPVPKIIDFGIAKATGRQLTDKTLFTQFHAFLGTPAYTSPEQMEMSGLDVDTRSDIYSLGVLLYELLTGRPPFDPDALARSGLEAMRSTIRESDPPRPSARLDTLPVAERTTVAQRRGTDAARLSCLLRGDLDWIVMRCLEKDRTRRYETASALAHDVEHHLANKPVAARPPGRLYRLGKFVHRHRVGVAAGAAIMLSLVGGLIASSVLFVRERAAHRRAVASEQAESLLRRQAEESRFAAAKRAAVIALEVADRHLADGKVAEGLAYLVHAARFDPRHPVIAPRLASVLASGQFLLPEGEPLQMGAGLMALQFTADGRHLEILSESGALAAVDLDSGQTRRGSLPTAVNLRTSFGSDSRRLGILGRDGVVRIIDRATFRILREIRFEQRPLTLWNFDERVAKLLVVLEDRTTALVDPDTGEIRPLARQDDPANPASLLVDRHGGRWMVGRVPPDRLEVRDMETGKLLHVGTVGERMISAVVSNDGTRLAALTASEGTPPHCLLHVWSLPDLRPLAAAVPVTVAMGGSIDAYVKFSSAGDRLLVWGPGGRQVYDAATGRPVGPGFRGSPALGLAHASFLPGGKRLAATVEGGIQIIETDTGAPLTPVLAHPGPIRQMSFWSGDLLLTTCSDGFARLWDIATGRLIAQPVVQDETGIVATLSRDGTRLIVGTAGGAVHRFRVEHRAIRPIVLPRRTDAPMPARFLSGSPARFLWLGAEHARVIDVASGRDVAGGFEYPEPIGGIRGGRGGPAVADDFGSMVVRTRRSDRWQAWHLGPRGVERVVPLENSPAGDTWVCLSPVGDTVALIAEADASTIRFWDLQTGKTVGQPIVSGAGFYTSNAHIGGFSPDGRHFVAGANDGRVTVCDVATGRQTLQLGPMRESRFKFVGYSPDGSRIGTAQAALGDVQLWDPLSGRPVGPVRRFGSTMSNAGFSHDGSQFVACPTGRPVSVWHSRDGTAATDLPVRSGARSARFSPDDRRIITSSNETAGIWHATTGLPETESMRHSGRVVTGTFSPDGRFLCTEVAQSATAPTSFCLWSVPPAGGDVPVPEWLLQLATIYAGKRIDDAGKCVDAPVAAARLDELRRELVALPRDAPFTDWGRWILDDQPDRPIAPGFTITPAEADQLAANLNAAAP